jgi:hypothetical protein
VAWQTTHPGVLALAVTGLLTIAAVARVTRLFNEDSLTQPLRTYLDRKAEDRWYAADESHPTVMTHAVPAPLLWRWAAKLVRCPWCLGFWIAAAFVGAYFRLLLGTWPWHTGAHAFGYLVAVFATSQIVGLAAEWLDSPPPIRQVQLLPAHVTVRKDNPTP